MEGIYELNSAEWAQNPFSAVVLGDKQRTKRAVALASTLLASLAIRYRFKPQASLN
ncbi:MAG TPA: transposase DNA-binding-containing protein [Chloroflexia bacterium]|nr:transposase DNA-binding-containing protein [Chloroflexia bacterium]